MHLAFVRLAFVHLAFVRLAFVRFGIRAFGIQSPHPVRAPIATKFAIEGLATQKDNKTQEMAEVEIRFIRKSHV